MDWHFVQKALRRNLEKTKRIRRKKRDEKTPEEFHYIRERGEFRAPALKKGTMGRKRRKSSQGPREMELLMCRKINKLGHNTHRRIFLEFDRQYKCARKRDRKAGPPGTWE